LNQPSSRCRYNTSYISYKVVYRGKGAVVSLEVAIVNIELYNHCPHLLVVHALQPSGWPPTNPRLVGWIGLDPFDNPIQRL
jgi:hypothetical protein